jgi:hypothetical protein
MKFVIYFDLKEYTCKGIGKIAFFWRGFFNKHFQIYMKSRFYLEKSIIMTQMKIFIELKNEISDFVG